MLPSGNSIAAHWKGLRNRERWNRILQRRLSPEDRGFAMRLGGNI